MYPLQASRLFVGGLFFVGGLWNYYFTILIITDKNTKHSISEFCIVTFKLKVRGEWEWGDAAYRNHILLVSIHHVFKCQYSIGLTLGLATSNQTPTTRKRSSFVILKDTVSRLSADCHWAKGWISALGLKKPDSKVIVCCFKPQQTLIICTFYQQKTDSFWATSAV